MLATLHALMDSGRAAYPHLAWLIELVWMLAKIVAILAPIMLAVSYYTLAERKVIGWMQVRIGPNRVGPLGLFQPFADALKLMQKETIIPTHANKVLFIVGPIVVIAPALTAWAVLPFSPELVLANLDIGLLFLLAMTSLAVYGVIIAGWASNSKYAFLGAMRSAAQVVSYEISMGFALVGVLIAASSMNLGEVVMAQQGGIGDWFVWPLFPLFMVYWISGIAETNRAPFDVAEGESEIVAGFHVEYSSMTFAVFFLAEYANMILVSFLTALLFFGGWLSPFDGLGIPVLSAPSFIWLLIKALFFAFMYLWLRATFPRYRYDQIMRLCWKVLLPVTIVYLPVVAIMAKLGWWFD